MYLLISYSPIPFLLKAIYGGTGPAGLQELFRRLNIPETTTECLMSGGQPDLNNDSTGIHWRINITPNLEIIK